MTNPGGSEPTQMNSSAASSHAMGQLSAEKQQSVPNNNQGFPPGPALGRQSSNQMQQVSGEND